MSTLTKYILVTFLVLITYLLIFWVLFLIVKWIDFQIENNNKKIINEVWLETYCKIAIDKNISLNFLDTECFKFLK